MLFRISALRKLMKNKKKVLVAAAAGIASVSAATFVWHQKRKKITDNDAFLVHTRIQPRKPLLFSGKTLSTSSNASANTWKQTIHLAGIKLDDDMQYLGILEEDVEIPPIPYGSTVLDVGAGTGFITERIRNLGCNVYALEPSFSCDTDYETCVKRLGEDRVEKLTLQEALQTNPEKYFQAFDVITVFKYNVPYTDKDDFLNSLAKAIKPGGIVYITSVERERFFRDSYCGEGPFLTETMGKYFSSIEISENRQFKGSYGLMTCTGPTPKLEEKFNFFTGPR